VRLAKILGLLVNLAGLRIVGEEISPAPNNLVNCRAEPAAAGVLAAMLAPGKSELAETIGDAVARREDRYHPISR